MLGGRRDDWRTGGTSISCTGEWGMGPTKAEKKFCFTKNLYAFSITRDEDLVDVYQLRNYDDLEATIVSVINDCSFFKILQMFAVEAGFTLSTLYKMDKIRDVRDQIGSQGTFFCVHCC